MLRTALLTLVALAVFQSSAWGRKWTDVTGSFSVEAELVEVKAGYALLQRADGKQVSVPILKLSAEDRAFIRKKMTAGGAERKTAPPTPAPAPATAPTAPTRRPRVGATVKSQKVSAPLPVENLLKKSIRFSAAELPLRDLAKQIGEVSGMPIFIDRVALDESGVSVDEPIRLAGEATTVRKALDTIAVNEDLDWLVREQVVVITTTDAAGYDWLCTRVYQCKGVAADALRNRIQQSVDREGWIDVGGPATAETLGTQLLVIRQSGGNHRKILETFGANLKLVPPKPTPMGPIEDKLRHTIDWTIRDMPLTEFAQKLTKDLGVDVVVDDKSLADEGWDVEMPINLEMTNTTVENGLRLALRAAGIGWTIDKKMLVITTTDSVEDRVATKNFNVRHLVGRGEGFDPLQSCIQATISPDHWVDVGGNGTINAIPTGFLSVTHSAPALWEIQQLLDTLSNVGK